MMSSFVLKLMSGPLNGPHHYFGHKDRENNGNVNVNGNFFLTRNHIFEENAFDEEGKDGVNFTPKFLSLQDERTKIDV